MIQPEDAIKEDILALQDIQGTNLMYLDDHGSLIAVELDDEGDEVARYSVIVHIEKL